MVCLVPLLAQLNVRHAKHHEAVMGYETDAFPAFFTKDSGCPAPMRVDSAREVAEWIYACSNLGLSSGSVVAVPNP